jgi:hypothetical protein
MIVAMRFHGTALPPLELSDARRIYTIGSGACDLVIPAELARDVAPVHATIERVEDAIRIGDQLSRHGLYRSPRSPPVAELLLHAGSIGWIGSCPVLALDRELIAVRTRLTWAMGLAADAAVDDALAAVASREPLLLLGPHGLDEAPLLASLDPASQLVDLDHARPLSAPLAAQLFSPRRDLRVVFRSTRASRARSVLDTYLERVRVLRLAPLSARPADVVPLLQAIWRSELRSPRRVEELGPRALAALVEHPWPGQLDELRANAARLLAYLDHRSLQAAARALGITRQTLAGHFARIGMPTQRAGERGCLAHDEPSMTANSLSTARDGAALAQSVTRSDRP